MILARTKTELRGALEAVRSRGRTIALVPTMGCLHEGHLALVDHARTSAEEVAVSIFVNPLQFGAREDLADYPRELDRDVELARERGVSIVFAPGVEEMYPGGAPAVTVDPGELGERLCGAYRPGHFRGVLTVVAKLFELFRPDLAVFGEKDFQQSILIQRMVRDLDMGTGVQTAPIVREEDGLAMSSRNRYLSAADRRAAPALHRGLRSALHLFREGGESSGSRLLDAVREEVGSQPRFELQYLDLVDPGTLKSLDDASPGSVIALAAIRGAARLIDNVTL